MNITLNDGASEQNELVEWLISYHGGNSSEKSLSVPSKNKYMSEETLSSGISDILETDSKKSCENNDKKKPPRMRKITKLEIKRFKATELKILLEKLYFNGTSTGESTNNVSEMKNEHLRDQENYFFKKLDSNSKVVGTEQNNSNGKNDLIARKNELCEKTLESDYNPCKIDNINSFEVSLSGIRSFPESSSTMDENNIKLINIPKKLGELFIKSKYLEQENFGLEFVFTKKNKSIQHKRKNQHSKGSNNEILEHRDGSSHSHSSLGHDTGDNCAYKSIGVPSMSQQ